MLANPLSPRNAGLSALSFALLIGGVAEARHSPLDGRIRVTNHRARTVRIVLDGDVVSRLNAGETTVLKGVPNGVRLLEVRGRNGPPQVERVNVPASGVARMHVKALRGTARLTNQSRVRLVVEIDGERVGVVGPGRHLDAPPMRPGRHKVRAWPVAQRDHRGPVIERTVQVTAGRQTALGLGEWRASVNVHNPLHSRARLYVDGQRVNRLRGDGHFRVRDLSPGRHTIELRGRNDVIATTTLRLAPGAREDWRPQAPMGALLVNNSGGHSVTVQVDDGRRFELRAGASRRVPRLRHGQHTVRITNRRGRTVERTVRVRRGELARLDLSPRDQRVASRRDRHNHG